MSTYNNSSDQSITQYNVITGGSANTVNNVAPSATSGVPVISQGSSSQPIFGTAVVAGGGTGVTSTTAYAVLCGGTTSTAALQSIASVGTSGQVLTSNGAGALPTFQAAGAGGGNSSLFSQFPLAPLAFAGVTYYIVPGGGSGNTSANNYYFPSAGTVSKLYVYVQGPNASSTNVTVTFYKNGSSTSLVATVTAGNTGVFTDLTHSVSVAAGDYGYWVVTGATTASVSNGQIVMNFNG